VKNVVGSSFSFEFFKKPENGAQLSLFSCTSAQATTKAVSPGGGRLVVSLFAVFTA
jgi:hypothetical protein